MNPFVPFRHVDSLTAVLMEGVEEVFDLPISEVIMTLRFLVTSVMRERRSYGGIVHTTHHTPIDFAFRVDVMRATTPRTPKAKLSSLNFLELRHARPGVQFDSSIQTGSRTPCSRDSPRPSTGTLLG